MDYKPKNNNYGVLRNHIEETKEKLRNEPGYEVLFIEESKTFDKGLTQTRIRAERTHKKNQELSRRTSAEIVFNA